MAQAMDDPTPMHDLNSFQRDLLYAIRRLDAPNGFDIRAVMKDAYGEEINTGRLYPSLDALVEKGLLNKEKEAQQNKYQLTPQAELEVAEDLDWRMDA